jgi:hypothetical protein
VSKATLALLILTGAVPYDPPRAQTFGWMLQSALDRALPQISNAVRR